MTHEHSVETSLLKTFEKNLLDPCPELASEEGATSGNPSALIKGAIITTLEANPPSVLEQLFIPELLWKL